MKVKLAWLALAAALFVPSAPPVSAQVVDSYVEGNYQYTCIIRNDHKYCGNWNVVSGG